MEIDIQDKLAYLQICKEAIQYYSKKKDEYNDSSKDYDSINSGHYLKLWAISSSQVSMYSQLQENIVEDLVRSYGFQRYTEMINPQLNKQLKLALTRTQEERKSMK